MTMPLRVAKLSDMGRRRSNNEDRLLVEPDLGVFCVVDGVGGHAAGELAADTAVAIMRARLSRPTGTPKQRVREAIALANNEIWAMANSQPEWNGMACVLTLALVEDGLVTVGHVGDSRLYLLRDGKIEKKTKDHSPVGEREDSGELTEREAMQHSRRNEIFRDVGAQERHPDDPAFIDILEFELPPDGAILLCSDGLSDLVDSKKILAGVTRYANDPDHAVAALVDAANQAGGKDNITVVLVTGPDFGAEPEPDVTARLQPAKRPPYLFLAFVLLIGIGLGLLKPWVEKRFEQGPRIIPVTGQQITPFLVQAHSGDTVVVPPGTYRENLVLPEGVILQAQHAGQATLLGSISAQGLQSGALEGLVVQGDRNNPMPFGIKLLDSTVNISGVRVSNAVTGIVFTGHSEGIVASNLIVNNLGAGFEISGTARPRLENNLIAANGNGKPETPKPGVEVRGAAKPVLKDNAIVNNAADAVWIEAAKYESADFEANFFGGVAPKKAIRSPWPEVVK